MKKTVQRAVASANRRNSAIRFAELKLRRYWLPLMIGIGLLILQQLSGINGGLFYSSTIFEEAGVTSTNVATFGLGAAQVLATIVTTTLADKAGHRLLLLLSSTGMTVNLLLVSVSFYVKDAASDGTTLYTVCSILLVVGVVFAAAWNLFLAECEELQRKVDSLCGENQSLTKELQRLTEECTS